MELHTVVDGLPSGVVGEMFPVVVRTIGEGMVPSGAAGAMAVGDIIVVDAVMAVVPDMDVETVPGTVDRTGTGTGVIEDCGGGGATYCGTGMLEPGKTVAADVSGCWENVSGGITIGGSADVVGAVETDGVVPIVAPVAKVEGAADIMVAAGVPGVICPVGVEQVTTVPGTVGSEASGTGANVVSGVPGCTVEENGLGP